ncbi:MAG: hypothetical protein DME94_10280 [Verrucomicrobia bacterium]|nr:MAG: hypothetical protein DME94_10280 [Verrucomicrobiota bacterium]
MKKVTIVSLAACAVLAAGCNWIGIRGNGHIKTDERRISAFADIDVRGTFEIEWQSGAPALRITTDENLLAYIHSNVSGDTLHLRIHEQLRPTHGIKIVISSPTRTGASLSGAVKLTAKQLSGPRFAVESRGTGASELAASALQTKTAQISTTGAGDAQVAVAETLKVAITGAGKVQYSGNPPTIEKHISGAGSIRRKD